jgi:thiol-disulfide isomerase/thioredoxin
MPLRAVPCLVLLLSLQGAARADLISQVRALAGSGQSAAALQAVEQARAQGGVTPELLEALSWIARADLARKQYDAALTEAQKTRDLCRQALQGRTLDAEPHLPIALGAAIEVQAQAQAAQGEGARAVALLRQELAQYGGTSIATRLWKNLNLLTLDGKPAPPIDTQVYLGPKPQALSALKGHPVLLFFWAHWCGDCKAQAQVVARLRTEFAQRGLVVLAPTQRYGFVSSGQEAAPDAELRYIEEVRQRAYGALLDVPAPVSEASFRSYGASSTPTLVVVSRAGLVTLYHPGQMSYDELKPHIESALR